MARTSSSDFLSFFSIWIAEVPDEQYGCAAAAAGLTALPQATISFSTSRARPQMTGPLISLAMVDTDSKSPGDEIGNPASMTSTLSRASCRAMRTFCLTERLDESDCSPSRSVVSNMKIFSFFMM